MRDITKLTFDDNPTRNEHNQIENHVKNAVFNELKNGKSRKRYVRMFSKRKNFTFNLFGEKRTFYYYAGHTTYECGDIQIYPAHYELSSKYDESILVKSRGCKFDIEELEKYLVA